jgi:hypothetical protein
VSRNGRKHPPRPSIEVAEGGVSAEEAAAIAAAIEQFIRDTAPVPQPAGPSLSPWRRTGLFEVTGLDPGPPSPWGDSQPWGRTT